MTSRRSPLELVASVAVAVVQLASAYVVLGRPDLDAAREFLTGTGPTMAGSVAAACGGSEAPPPQACLTPIQQHDGAVDAPSDGTDDVAPQVCLKVAPPDAGEDSSNDTGAG